MQLSRQRIGANTKELLSRIALALLAILPIGCASVPNPVPPNPQPNNLREVALGCVPRGQACKGPGFYCLVMFPEDLRPWYDQILNRPNFSFAGQASVRMSASPTLRYELSSPIAPEVKVFPIDRDIPLDDQVARLLGFGGVTIRQGNYEVNRKIGKFGTIDFTVMTSGASQDKIGAIHNRALEYLYQDSKFLEIVKNREKGPFTLAEIANIQTLTKPFLMQEGFSAAEVDAAGERALRVIEDLGVFDATAALSPRTLATAEAKGYIPREVASEWTTVLERAAKGERLPETLRYVNGSIKPRLEQTCNGRYAEVFRDVVQNSSQFWRPKPGTGVILADGVGALYGLLLGPVGSIIEGTLFSVIANESKTTF